MLTKQTNLKQKNGMILNSKSKNWTQNFLITGLVFYQRRMRMSYWITPKKTSLLQQKYQNLTKISTMETGLHNLSSYAKIVIQILLLGSSKMILSNSQLCGRGLRSSVATLI